jgi:hypothetical protein
MTLRDLMSAEQREREDTWQQAKWESLVRYVRGLSTADKLKWSLRQSEATKDRMRSALSEANIFNQ